MKRYSPFLCLALLLASCESATPIAKKPDSRTLILSADCVYSWDDCYEFIVLNAVKYDQETLSMFAIEVESGRMTWEILTAPTPNVKIIDGGIIGWPLTSNEIEFESSSDANVAATMISYATFGVSRPTKFMNRFPQK